MEKIVTETGKSKLIIETTEKIKITVDRGGWYEAKRSIELTKRQTEKLIAELQSALANCG